ncbi:hypothetical protein ACFL6D_02915 [Spirochaetota bacterium]
MKDEIIFILSSLAPNIKKKVRYLLLLIILLLVIFLYIISGPLAFFTGKDVIDFSMDAEKLMEIQRIKTDIFSYHISKKIKNTFVNKTPAEAKTTVLDRYIINGMMTIDSKRKVFIADRGGKSYYASVGYPLDNYTIIKIEKNLIILVDSKNFSPHNIDELLNSKQIPKYLIQKK